MKAIVYRYNSKNRNDRQFNNLGIEKNPNAINFYASNLDYANNYKYVFLADGDVDYACSLEEKEVSTENLFDMASNFESLATFQNYIKSEIGLQLRDYTRFFNEAKSKSDKKMWGEQISELENRKNELIDNLVRCEFQTLSDFDIQNELVSELTSLGFSGYKTINEIAIF